MRRVAGEARPKQKVLYKIAEWPRDSVLEMVGLDPYDARSQYEFHCRQGLDPQQPPLCIRKDTCPGQYHFFVDCPNAPYGDDFAGIWGYWAAAEETEQQKQWDNYAKQSTKSTGASGSAAYYPTCNITVDVPEFDGARKDTMDSEHGQYTPKFDGPRHEPMDLEHEQQSSFDFNK